MHYGIFLITTDEDGNETVGTMVSQCVGWTAACQFIRNAYAMGALEDGTPVPVNGLKALELICEPQGNELPRIMSGQIVLPPPS